MNVIKFDAVPWEMLPHKKKNEVKKKYSHRFKNRRKNDEVYLTMVNYLRSWIGV